MMAQYRGIKQKLSADTLLLFRLGDFYEMFFEDAKVGAQILNVALTRRGQVPTCGIPYHAAHAYLARILKAGRKVALCDQVEEARPGQLVKREITQILSPGAHLDERLLSAEKNNYLAAICPAGPRYGLAVADLTTADFKVTECSSESDLRAELERLGPAEIIFPSAARGVPAACQGLPAVLNEYDDWVFAPETSVFTLRDHFKVLSLDGLGLKGLPGAVGAAGAILHYLGQHLYRDITHLTRLSCYQSADYLVLDPITLRNLEIFEARDGSGAGREGLTLYGVTRRTRTPMGARKLREWLSQPLGQAGPIRARQEAIERWLAQPALLQACRDALGEIRDLERTMSRLSMGSGNGRDLIFLACALKQIPAIRELVEKVLGAPAPLREGGLGFENLQEQEQRSAERAAEGAERLFRSLRERLTECPHLVELIQKAIVDNPPLSLKEGGLIRPGFDENLDEIQTAMRDGKNWIAQLQQEEIQKTGIGSLKVRFNSVFGYYIEVTKSHLDKIPPHYIRKQTIANGERFFTDSLKTMEGKILGAQERSTKLEYDLFQKVREETLAELAVIQGTAAALGELDVLASFAETARLHHYCRPRVEEGLALRIREGRHPVLDQSATGERFIANDTDLDGAEQQIALITGPNMAGKSTYIRQVALLVLLAHTGSFVPAAEADIALVDRIFTRIGASDDLSSGQSTFMVEMTETANILNNATRRSLVILDEIGRGTSTFDGLSLAWSIVEYLHNQVGAKTLFATHYHELAELAARLPRLKNFNVAVREWHDQIVFLRKIVEGGTDKSYGIQVARLAGVPKPGLERSKEILRNLEESELTPEGNVRQSSRRQHDRDQLKQLAPPPQMDLFG